MVEGTDVPKVFCYHDIVSIFENVVHCNFWTADSLHYSEISGPDQYVSLL